MLTAVPVSVLCVAHHGIKRRHALLARAGFSRDPGSSRVCLEILFLGIDRQDALPYRSRILGRPGSRLQTTDADGLVGELLAACQFTVTMISLVRQQFEPSLRDQLPPEEFEALELALRSVQRRAEAAVRRSGAPL